VRIPPDVLKDNNEDLKVYAIPEDLLLNSFDKGWRINFGEVMTWDRCCQSMVMLIPRAFAGDLAALLAPEAKEEA
jgi:hypothetical protein